MSIFSFHNLLILRSGKDLGAKLSDPLLFDVSEKCIEKGHEDSTLPRLDENGN